FTIVPLYLTSYFDADIHLFYLYGKIILFGNYYLILFIFTYVIGKNMYVMLLPICGYFCSNLSAEFYIGKNDVSWFTKSSNLLFEDIGYYLNTGFDFYYGFTYLLSILMLLIIAIVFLSIKSDILN
ncbi:MAG: hypothetical protein JXR62_03930, partial [Bacilli bacterium]|nr:hypothetical protein [Bacilli bacterium]